MKLKDGMQNSVGHDQTGSEAAVRAGSVPFVQTYLSHYYRLSPSFISWFQK